MNFWQICASSLALAFLCSCDKDGVVLAFNTQNAVPQTFHLESSLNVLLPEDSTNSKPESMLTHVKVRSTSNLLVPYDDGSARFEMKIDSVEYTSDKRSVEEFRNMEKFLSTQHFQYKLSSDGAVSEPSVEDSMLQPGAEDLDLVKLFLKAQPVLPGTPVSVGDSWERSLAIPGNGTSTNVYKTFVLEDVFLHEGSQMAKIGMNLKYKELPDSTSDLRMESTGFVVGSGYVLFDISHGVIANANLELNGDLKIRDLVSNDTIPNMHVIQKIRLRGEL